MIVPVRDIADIEAREPTVAAASRRMVPMIS
jgi:hypothetical protein